MNEEQARRDRGLGARIDAGDMAALEEAYDAYCSAIYGQALAILGSAADAEDVVQDVFLQLVRRRGYPIRELKAYLLCSARHQACSALRRRQRETPDPNAEAAESLWPASAGQWGDREAVREALAALPPEQREVIRLKVYEQWTFAEISGAVRVSINTVASRYRYALEKLRKALGESVDVS